ncbi:MAG: response regulator [Proteobacteria bacterium]|nr:response regulator [Pseudomonadota bacterium]MBU4296517.1 response regulator [Pseudomonadota bacterium]MCG2746898.1 response regulator [Desulfobulbaceae bacterium]
MEEKLEAKVLLVDDEEEFCNMLSERLETRGMKVNAVLSGEDAVKRVEDQNFDAIILDLAMPGIDGIETLRRIKEMRPDLEILMLTGHGTVKSGIEAMKLGAEDFLEKPVDMKVLMAKISEAKHKRMLILEKRSREEVENIIRSKSW